jgi:hypothetical protein
MADASDNGQERPPFNPIVPMQGTFQFQFQDTAIQVGVDQNGGDHPIRLVLTQSWGVHVIALDGPTCQEFANGLLQAVRTASTGIVTAKELPKDFPPIGGPRG